MFGTENLGIEMFLSVSRRKLDYNATTFMTERNRYRKRIHGKLLKSCAQPLQHTIQEKKVSKTK